MVRKNQGITVFKDSQEKSGIFVIHADEFLSTQQTALHI